MNLRIAAQSDHSFGANRCHKKRKKKNKVDAGPSEDHGELEAKRAKMNERVTDVQNSRKQKPSKYYLLKATWLVVIEKFQPLSRDARSRCEMKSVVL
ncbi:unnamed protein product, partial [Mesorhabditis belari]|uniref:Uncharacterized protein n=1 Tax=Mesorhabditis belari TaxID=2138241 RepID=A0AAF3JC11_9BILA